MARNRKRAKEKRARRPESVAAGRHDRAADALNAPDPISHATPDVELAEAQLEVGRPDLNGETAPAPSEQELAELATEAEADGGGSGAGGGTVAAAPAGGTGGGGPGAGGAELAVPASVAPAHARPNAINRLIHFLQGSWAELQRVQWPDRRQVMQATGVVIGFVIVAGVFLGVADLVSTKIVNLILK